MPATMVNLVRTLQEAQDSIAADPSVATPYDTIWTVQGPLQTSTPLEQVMLADDKLFVVLGVVLIIWIGLIMLLIRTDRRLKRLERTAEEHIPEEDPF